jgi:hypothetical protein
MANRSITKSFLVGILLAGLGAGIGLAQYKPKDPTATISAEDMTASVSGYLDGQEGKYGEHGGKAQLALTGQPSGGYSFHTDGKQGSYWMVTFKAPVDITWLTVFNRREAHERAAWLEVWIAPDGISPVDPDDPMSVGPRSGWKLACSQKGVDFIGVDDRHHELPPTIKGKDKLGRITDIQNPLGPLEVAAASWATDKNKGIKYLLLRLDPAYNDWFHLDKVFIEHKVHKNVSTTPAEAPKKDLFGNDTDSGDLKLPD